MADPTREEWSSNSNETLYVSLVRPTDKGVETLHTFNPKMTYSIFGDEETVFGYKDLRMKLRFNISDMRPGTQVLYTTRFKQVGDTQPTDIREVLEPYLPANAFEKSADFEAAITNSSNVEWTPPGNLVKTMEHDGQQFEIWKGCLADPAVKQLAKRIQIFVPLFIEGGTLIDLEDNDEILGRWTFFFLYAKQHNPTPGKSPYMFVGYSTVFRYYMYQRLTPPPEAPDRTQNAAPEYELPLSEVSFYDLPCRSRISQFLILPPFANKGAGSRFYNAIFEHFTQDPTTVEITVEDPNVDFDDMRDINDLIYLRTIPEFTALRINTNTKPRRDGSVPRDIIDLDSAEKIRAKHKIAPRQYNRLIEMQLLSLIPLGVRQSLIAERLKISGDELKAKKDEYRLWQLLAKQRLYKHNRDMLMQLERAERIDKLDETSSAVEADYARLLRAVEKRVSGKFHEGKGKAGKANGNGLLKRSSPDEAEESDEGEPTAKKVKFA